MSKKSIQDLGYDDWQHLSDKIDNEGGLGYFLTQYTGASAFQNTKIEKEVRDFVNAYYAFFDKLEDLIVEERDD